MLKAVPTSQAQQKHDKRELYTLAVTKAETISIKKVFDTKSMLSTRKANVQLDNPIHITGEALTKFTDSKNQPYVHNVTLTDADTGNILLQRFAPPFLNIAELMDQRATEGICKFQNVCTTAKCKKHSPTTCQIEDWQKSLHFHFGAWYNQTKVNLVISSETHQAGNEAGKPAVADFIAWFKIFFSEHVQKSIVNNKNSGLCDSFCQELTDREQIHFPWANKHVEGLDVICQPLYLTFSLFQGFSGTSHIDNKDADVSILINLGQHAILELHEYNCQLVLQPLDVVFFLLNSVYHHTLQHPAHIEEGSDPNDQMAITCLFHKALMMQKEPKKHNILYLICCATEKQEAERQKELKRKLED
ncbi:uncharacterized protein SPSC_05782 [Sporisorium scitamineum]|uniref:Uncharacterized protein n=1 Tax=Sporisorium scitamineum TaxID=49012 RepID=A0A127Z523_9BASI|nr:uncharacterized protein SPSC_05782 [Sporisorium scitamineum]